MAISTRAGAVPCRACQALRKPTMGAGGCRMGKRCAHQSSTLAKVTSLSCCISHTGYEAMKRLIERPSIVLREAVHSGSSLVMSRHSSQCSMLNRTRGFVESTWTGPIPNGRASCSRRNNSDTTLLTQNASDRGGDALPYSLHMDVNSFAETCCRHVNSSSTPSTRVRSISSTTASAVAQRRC
jgi:hypothetical protein